MGNWENLVWSWQLSFVVPTALICGILLVMIAHSTLATPDAAVFVGVSLVSLPLCGGVGLLFVPFLALWLSYCGVLHWYAVKANGGRQWISGVLIGSAAIALNQIQEARATACSRINKNRSLFDVWNLSFVRITLLSPLSNLPRAKRLL